MSDHRSARRAHRGDAYDANWGELMAGSTMICVSLLLLFAFLSKYFIRGLSMGAVKS